MNYQYAEFVKNKKVAIVGPAQYMAGSGFGKEIDEFDIVVRLNRSCESIEKFYHDIGKRTDILYSCLIEKPANAGVIDINVFKDKYGIKHICAPPASDMKGYARSTSLHPLVNIVKVKKINEQIPVRIVDHVFHSSLGNKVDCRPNTGYMAIYDLLRYDIEKLKIFGFSFYLDGFIEGVKSGIENEQNKSEAEFALQCFRSKRHNQKNMWEYAKKTLTNNPKVELDNMLEKILNLENLDKNLFKSIKK